MLSPLSNRGYTDISSFCLRNRRRCVHGVGEEGRFADRLRSRKSPSSRVTQKCKLEEGGAIIHSSNWQNTLHLILAGVGQGGRGERGVPQTWRSTVESAQNWGALPFWMLLAPWPPFLLLSSSYSALKSWPHQIRPVSGPWHLLCPLPGVLFWTARSLRVFSRRPRVFLAPCLVPHTCTYIVSLSDLSPSLLPL